MNKVDRLYNWKSVANSPIQDAFARQEEYVRKEFEDRFNSVSGLSGGCFCAGCPRGAFAQLDSWTSGVPFREGLLRICMLPGMTCREWEAGLWPTWAAPLSLPCCWEHPYLPWLHLTSTAANLAPAWQLPQGLAAPWPPTGWGLLFQVSAPARTALIAVPPAGGAPAERAGPERVAVLEEPGPPHLHQHCAHLSHHGRG